MAKEENEKEKNKPKPCPKWLNNTAKKEWRRVAKILAEEGKDFTDKDLKALEAYCINYAKWQRCEQIIDEKGYSTLIFAVGYAPNKVENTEERVHFIGDCDKVGTLKDAIAAGHKLAEEL